MSESLLQQIVKLHGPQAVQDALTVEQFNSLRYEWRAWARPEQLPPSGTWNVWLAKSGRGSGKTRTGAEWVRSLAEANGQERIALVAPTASDARDVMVEGESGIMSVCPPWFRPTYEPSKRRITWPNGAMAITYSAEEADRLRGPQHSHAWGDELCSWEKGDDVWNMLMFGLRLGSNPRTLVTTTPRPTDLIRMLIKSPTTVTVGGSTYDNAANLPPAFIEAIKAKYEGTRLGRQEIHAEILDDVEGALWTHATIDRSRRTVCPELRRIVVAVDPSGSAKRTADEAGIVVAGIGECSCLGRPDTHAFVLEDLTGRYSPRDMGNKAIGAYHKYQANRLVAEDNFGGKIIEDLVQLIDSRVAYRAVHASRGKLVRAEPVAALYEQGKVHHIGLFKELEDEMCFAAGTLVHTARGQIPIEHVTTKDLALTRRGYRRVIWSGMTGLSLTVKLKTDSGAYLQCTPRHPIFVAGKGFIRCDEVETGDRLLLCTQSNDRSLSLTEGVTFLPTTVISRPVGLMGVACFTGIYGSLPTAPSQADGMFTTEMRTGETMRRPTSSRYLDLTIRNSTSRAAHGASRSMSEVLEKKPNGPQGNHMLSFVERADVRLPHCRLRPGSAAGDAGQASPVYDISVEGDHEFFANGILVHNCTYAPLISTESPGRLDAMVWAITDLMLTQPVTLGEAPVTSGARRGQEVTPDQDDDEDDAPYRRHSGSRR